MPVAKARLLDVFRELLRVAIWNAAVRELEAEEAKTRIVKQTAKFGRCELMLMHVEQQITASAG